MIKVIVIIDDDHIQQSIKTLLEEEGYVVYIANNGQIGIQMTQEILPDVVICGVDRPEIDGYMELNLLRSNPLTSTIPFVFLTNNTDESTKLSSMILSVDSFKMPFPKVELLELISSCLNKKDSPNLPPKQVESRINNALYYDSITGLLNRLSLREEFLKQKAISIKDNTLIALIYMSLDRFVQLSENLDIFYQEAFLREISQELNFFVEKDNTAKAFRIQNDEFVILMSSYNNKIDYSQICSDLLIQFARPFKMDQFELYTTASLGMSFYPFDGSEIEDLLTKSRSSMLSAKKGGGNTFILFEAGIADTIPSEELKLEASLYKAFSQNELEVYYQPKINITTGKITGAEALIRWKHPEDGYISPSVFIPIAEKSGLIHPIGDWVMKTAFKELKWYLDKGFSSIKIAVNLSGRQLYDNTFVERLEQTGLEVGITFGNIELELTESTLVRDIAAAKTRLDSIKALGIQISIDDFGTGYSGLSYLKQLPFDILKIDRSFVQNVGSDRQNSALTLATIRMAHSLNLKVIAEGVETQQELNFLRQNGCDVAQGYFFSRPLNRDDFEEFLIQNLRETREDNLK